jgi:hypothetical protein
MTQIAGKLCKPKKKLSGKTVNIELTWHQLRETQIGGKICKTKKLLEMIYHDSASGLHLRNISFPVPIKLASQIYQVSTFYGAFAKAQRPCPNI